MRLIFVVALAAASLCAHAQDYPSKPVQLVSAVPIGSATDLLARQLSDRLGPRLGGSVIVVNKPGAGGIIATEFAAKSPADGYTLLFGNAALAANPFLYKKLPYDAQRDFAGIALVAESPYVVVVNNELGVKSMQALVALARAKPASINFASAGVGTATHLACELLARRAGVQFTHVPYSNTGAIGADLQSNTVQLMCSPPASIIPLLKNGRVSMIGVSALQPMTEPVAVPSVKQSTGIDFVASQWFGLFAPEKTPKPVLQRIAKAVEGVTGDAEFQQKLRDSALSSKPVFLTEFDEYLRKDMALWGPVVQATGVKLD